MQRETGGEDGTSACFHFVQYLSPRNHTINSEGIIAQSSSVLIMDNIFSFPPLQCVTTYSIQLCLL